MVEFGSAVGGVLGPEDGASERLEARLLRWDAAIRRSAAQLQRAEAARQRAEAARDSAEAARERALAARNKSDDVLEDIGGLRASVTGEPIANHGQGEADERERIADERDRDADEREAEADERDRIADQRDAEADEREGAANLREADADEREFRMWELQVEAREEERVARRAADQRADILARREAGFAERQRIDDQREVSGEMQRSAEELRRTVRAGDSLIGLADRAAFLRALAADLADGMAQEAEGFAAYLEDAATRGHRERRLAIAETEHEIARIERQNAARLRDLNKGYEQVEHLPKLPGSD